MMKTPAILVALGIATAGMANGVHPAAAQATETVYDCKFERGASPLTWAKIRHDDFTGRISVEASHIEAGSRIAKASMNKVLDETQFQHDVRNANGLENITSYRINTASGMAIGSVDLYDDDRNYIRGGPLPVDGRCTIVTAQAGSSIGLASPAKHEVCHMGYGATQFFDSLYHCVSSVLSPQAGNTYGPQNLSGGPEGAAWCEGVAGNGEGETIRIETSPTVTAYAISIRNGYQKSAAVFSNNGRVKTVEIEAAGRVERFTLRDAAGEQRLEFRKPIEANTFTARIVSVYPGVRYADTCISGLSLDLEGF